MITATLVMFITWFFDKVLYEVFFNLHVMWRRKGAESSKRNVVIQRRWLRARNKHASVSTIIALSVYDRPVRPGSRALPHLRLLQQRCECELHSELKHILRAEITLIITRFSFCLVKICHKMKFKSMSTLRSNYHRSLWAFPGKGIYVTLFSEWVLQAAVMSCGWIGHLASVLLYFAVIRQLKKQQWALFISIFQHIIREKCDNLAPAQLSCGSARSARIMDSFRSGELFLLTLSLSILRYFQENVRCLCHDYSDSRRYSSGDHGWARGMFTRTDSDIIIHGAKVFWYQILNVHLYFIFRASVESRFFSCSSASVGRNTMSSCHRTNCTRTHTTRTSILG